MTKQYITKVESNSNDEVIVLFPEELLSTLNLKPTDLLCWTALPEGAGFLINKIVKEIE